MATDPTRAIAERLAEAEAEGVVAPWKHYAGDAFVDLHYLLDRLAAAEAERDAAEAQCSDHQRGENDALNKLAASEAAKAQAERKTARCAADYEVVYNMLCDVTEKLEQAEARLAAREQKD